MTTRDFILVGAGAIAGYLLVGVLNKKNSVLDEKTGATSLPDTSSQTLPPSSTTDATDIKRTPKQSKTPKAQQTLTDPKVATCNENWKKFSRNKRFRSTEEKQSTYDKFIENCLVQSV